MDEMGATRWRCMRCSKLAYSIDDAPGPTRCNEPQPCKWIAQTMRARTAARELCDLVGVPVGQGGPRSEFAEADNAEG